MLLICTVTVPQFLEKFYGFIVLICIRSSIVGVLLIETRPETAQSCISLSSGTPAAVKIKLAVMMALSPCRIPILVKTSTDSMENPSTDGNTWHKDAQKVVVRRRVS